MHTCCLHVDLYCFSMGYIADPARYQTCDRDIGQLCAGSDFVLPKWLCILAVSCTGCDQKYFQLFRTPEISHPSCNSKTSAALTCATLLALGSKARTSHSKQQQRKCSTANAVMSDIFCCGRESVFITALIASLNSMDPTDQYASCPGLGIGELHMLCMLDSFWSYVKQQQGKMQSQMAEHGRVLADYVESTHASDQLLELARHELRDTQAVNKQLHQAMLGDMQRETAQQTPQSNGTAH